MATLHKLKTDPKVFQKSFDGVKHWEIRKDDRGFETGDKVVLLETTRSGEDINDGASLEFTGRKVSGSISYILRGPTYGLENGWCIFSLQDICKLHH